MKRRRKADERKRKRRSEACGRRGGRQPSPCTPAEEEREGGEDPPLLTLNMGEKGGKGRESKSNNIFIYPTGGNYAGSSANKCESNH